MKLMTKALERRVPNLYEQDGAGDDAIVYAHYFGTWNGWHWYMTEYDPKTKTAFGFVKGDFWELGYFSLAEFEQLNSSSLPWQRIERDMYWRECKLSEVKQ